MRAKGRRQRAHLRVWRACRVDGAKVVRGKGTGPFQSGQQIPTNHPINPTHRTHKQPCKGPGSGGARTHRRDRRRLGWGWGTPGTTRGTP